MVDKNSDDMLGARLDSALRVGLDLEQVDVATLLQGSRRRAQRVRAQRITAAVTTAVLVVAVPVGYEVLNAGTGATAPPAVLLPADSDPAKSRIVEPTPQPDPTAAPSPVPPSAAESLPTAIPDAFAFATTELPPGLVLESQVSEAGETLVDGQDCVGARPAISRRWVWSTNPGKADNLSVSLTVTGWAEKEAAAAFTEAIEGGGACTWKDPQTERVRPVGSAAQTWVATSETEGRHYGRALVRLGGGIVGIQVQDPNSAAAAAELADDLARIQLARLRTVFKARP